MTTASLEQVSVEQDGRILTGVGISEADLSTALSRETPDPAAPPASPSATEAPEPSSATPPEASSQPVRNADGTFAKPTRGQKRFDELTREREDARREAEAAKQEREALRQRLDALEKERQSAASPKATPEPAQTPAAKFPRWERWSESNPGKEWEDYQEARDAFLAEQVEARLVSRLEAERASRDFAEHLGTVASKAREVYPDFETVIREGDGATVDMPWSTLQAIAFMPDSEHVQYALAKDKALAERIAAISDPFQLGLALARIVPDRSSVAPPASTRPSAVTSKAPVPYQPVGTSSKTASPSLHELAAAGDYERYKAQRHAK